MFLWRFFLAIVASYCMAAPAWAQASDPAGRWALRSGDHTLMILELQPERGAAERWEGRLIRPRHFRISSGALPTFVATDPVVVSDTALVTTGPNRLTLLTRSPAGEETLWRLMIDRDWAFLTLDIPPGEATVLAPLRLVLAADREQVSTHLATGTTYVLSADLQTNGEMKAIFDADQADRTAGASIDWSAVGPRDAARRARTLALLNAGELRNGDDFWHAAFIFQHGSEPNSFLLAHTLATIAAARGRPDATWIAAATLDRYLHSIGRQQVYGTQYVSREGQPTTQEPYDRSVVSDALREALGVPSQSAQAERAREMDRRRRFAPTQH